MKINVAPTSKPRMTKSDKWKTRPIVAKYWKFKDDIKEALSLKFEANQVRHWLVFQVPMAASWSKKKKLKMDGKPHQQTPDVDNFIKGFFDAIAQDDSHIYEVHALKIWGVEPAIHLGKEDFNVISKALEEQEEEPRPTIQTVKVSKEFGRRLGGQGSVRMRGVLPRTQGRFPHQAES